MQDKPKNDYNEDINVDSDIDKNNETENFNDNYKNYKEEFKQSEQTAFNKNIINNQIRESVSSMADGNEALNNDNNYSVKTATEVAEADIKEEVREVSKPIFETISDKDMKIHEDMGAKNHIFGAGVNSSIDYDETPAFMRRPIVARNVKR